MGLFFAGVICGGAAVLFVVMLCIVCKEDNKMTTKNNLYSSFRL